MPPDSFEHWAVHKIQEAQRRRQKRRLRMLAAWLFFAAVVFGIAVVALSR